MNKPLETVSFTRMEDGTREEYAFLAQHEDHAIASVPDRMLEAMQQLDGSLEGYRVSRLEHSLQSATRAYEAGEDEEMVVAALFHDIGDILAPASHSEMAAAIIATLRVGAHPLDHQVSRPVPVVLLCPPL